MASKSKAGKAAAAGVAAKAAVSSPYVQRLINDPELRGNIRTAYDQGRKAATRLQNGKGPAKALLDDKKLHKDLQAAAVALRDAGDALREPQKKPKRKRRIGRLLMLAVVGGVAALALSEGLRNKLLDALFGAEEEFEYTSTTTPAPPPAQPAPTT